MAYVFRHAKFGMLGILSPYCQTSFVYLSLVYL